MEEIWQLHDMLIRPRGRLEIVDIAWDPWTGEWDGYLVTPF